MSVLDLCTYQLCHVWSRLGWALLVSNAQQRWMCPTMGESMVTTNPHWILGVGKGKCMHNKKIYITNHQHINHDILDMNNKNLRSQLFKNTTKLLYWYQQIVVEEYNLIQPWHQWNLPLDASSISLKYHLSSMWKRISYNGGWTSLQGNKGILWLGVEKAQGKSDLKWRQKRL